MVSIRKVLGLVVLCGGLGLWGTPRARAQGPSDRQQFLELLLRRQARAGARVPELRRAVSRLLAQRVLQEQQRLRPWEPLLGNRLMGLNRAVPGLFMLRWLLEQRGQPLDPQSPRAIEVTRPIEGGVATPFAPTGAINLLDRFQVAPPVRYLGRYRAAAWRRIIGRYRAAAWRLYGRRGG